MVDFQPPFFLCSLKNLVGAVSRLPLFSLLYCLGIGFLFKWWVVPDFCLNLSHPCPTLPPCIRGKNHQVAMLRQEKILKCNREQVQREKTDFSKRLPITTQCQGDWGWGANGVCGGSLSIIIHHSVGIIIELISLCLTGLVLQYTGHLGICLTSVMWLWNSQ